MTGIDDDLDLRERMLEQADTLQAIVRALAPTLERTWALHAEFDAATQGVQLTLDADGMTKYERAGAEANAYLRLADDYGAGPMWEAAMVLAVLAGGKFINDVFVDDELEQLRAERLGDE